LKLGSTIDQGERQENQRSRKQPDRHSRVEDEIAEEVSEKESRADHPPAVSRGRNIATVAEDIPDRFATRIGFGPDPDADLRPADPEPQQVVVLQNDLGDTLVVDEGTALIPLMPEHDFTVLHCNLGLKQRHSRITERVKSKVVGGVRPNSQAVCGELLHLPSPTSRQVDEGKLPNVLIAPDRSV
jgi:hypothetical protein